MLGKLTRIPVRIFRAIRCVFVHFARDNCPFMAASLAYYGVFSLFPLLLSSISVVGFLFPGDAAREQIRGVVDLYAPASAGLIMRNLDTLVNVRGRVGLFALATLVWAASAVFTALTRSINSIWKVENKRSFWQQKVFALIMVFFLGAVALASVAASAFFRILTALQANLVRWGVPALAEGTLWSLLGHFIPPVLTFLLFSFIYRAFPQATVGFRDIWLGALVASIGFEGAKSAFAWYLQNLSRYELIHGSITAVIVLLLWFYIAALVMLLGAEVTHLSYQGRLRGMVRE